MSDFRQVDFKRHQTGMHFSLPMRVLSSSDVLHLFPSVHPRPVRVTHRLGQRGIAAGKRSLMPCGLRSYRTRSGPPRKQIGLDFLPRMTRFTV